jgi:hypothetical protein
MNALTLRRVVAFILLALCFSVWTMAGNATANAADNGVDEAAQLAVVATISASPVQASAGATIVYTYRVTNTGLLPVTSVSAVDTRLGAVPGITGGLVPGASVSGTLNYIVLASDPTGPLVNTVNVFATSADGSTTATDSTTVLITSPTALEETEQPRQDRVTTFLPFVLPFGR